MSELARSVCFAIGQGLARGEGRGTGMSVSWQGQSASPSGGGLGGGWQRPGRAGRPAGGRKALAWMGGGLGGEAPPDGRMHSESAKARGHVQVQILSEKLNLDLKLEHVSWQGQCTSPSTGPGRADQNASEWTGPSGGLCPPSPQTPPDALAAGRRRAARVRSAEE